MIVEKRSKALSQRGPSLRYLVLHRNPIDFRGRQLLHRGSTLIENWYLHGLRSCVEPIKLQRWGESLEQNLLAIQHWGFWGLSELRTSKYIKNHGAISLRVYWYISACVWGSVSLLTANIPLMIADINKIVLSEQRTFNCNNRVGGFAVLFPVGGNTLLSVLCFVLYAGTYLMSRPAPRLSQAHKGRAESQSHFTSFKSSPCKWDVLLTLAAPPRAIYAIAEKLRLKMSHP